MTCPEIPGGRSPVGRAPCLEILIGSGADTAKNRSDGGYRVLYGAFACVKTYWRH